MTGCRSNMLCFFVILEIVLSIFCCLFSTLFQLSSSLVPCGWQFCCVGRYCSCAIWSHNGAADRPCSVRRPPSWPSDKSDTHNCHPSLSLSVCLFVCPWDCRATMRRPAPRGRSVTSRVTSLITSSLAALSALANRQKSIFAQCFIRRFFRRTKTETLLEKKNYKRRICDDVLAVTFSWEPKHTVMSFLPNCISFDSLVSVWHGRVTDSWSDRPRQSITSVAAMRMPPQHLCWSYEHEEQRRPESGYFYGVSGDVDDGRGHVDSARRVVSFVRVALQSFIH